MAFVSPRPGVRVECTQPIAPTGKPCESHLMTDERGWYCPTCGPLRVTRGYREAISAHDLLGSEEELVDVFPSLAGHDPTDLRRVQLESVSQLRLQDPEPVQPTNGAHLAGSHLRLTLPHVDE